MSRETIVCPDCQSHEVAIVMIGAAGAFRAHRCRRCRRVIWAKDWRRLPWWRRAIDSLKRKVSRGR